MGSSNNGQTKATPQDICNRCKKNNNWAKDCWQSHHKDSSRLKPNGVQKPKHLNNRRGGRINHVYDCNDQSTEEDSFNNVILVPDTDPEDKTKDSVHDGLFEVTDDEHLVEGLNSNHKAFKT